MAQRARVAVVKGEDAGHIVAEAVGLLGGMEKFVGKGATVLIKPNLGFPPPQGKKPSTELVPLPSNRIFIPAPVKFRYTVPLRNAMRVYPRGN